jgi:hypothetical protein
MSVFDYGAPIWVSVLGDTYVIDTAEYPTETFFGITSDTPITSFSLAS